MTQKSPKVNHAMHVFQTRCSLFYKKRNRSQTQKNKSPHHKQNKMALTVNHLFFFLFISTSLTISLSSDDCVYTVYIRTGSILKGGTDSIISLQLNDTSGDSIYIPNIETWGGLMGPDYNYFERGNLDIFSGRGKCLDYPVCAMNLTSDGSGKHHGWYCNYVEVTSTGVHIDCAQQLFTVEQWLATDTKPYELTAIRDSCSSSAIM